MLSLIYGDAYRDERPLKDGENVRVYTLGGKHYIGYDTSEILHVCDRGCAAQVIADEFLPDEVWPGDAYVNIHPSKTAHHDEVVRTVDVGEFDPGDDPYVLCANCETELLREDEKFEAMFGHPITEPRTVDPDAIYMVVSNEEHDDDGHPLWWSNADGWVTQESATRFTEAETRTLTLPFSGRWAEVAIDDGGSAPTITTTNS